MGLRCGLAVLFLLQLVGAAAVLFLPFGFDHPSSWGLDFDHLLRIAVLQVLVLLSGLALACVTKQWRWLGLQVLLTAVGLILFWEGDGMSVGAIGGAIALPLFLLAGVREVIRPPRAAGICGCTRCGYDLRCTLAAGRTECPECGTAMSSRAARSHSA